MSIPTAQINDAATRLHGYLAAEHWNGHALEGPDSGVRFNWRVGRFVKSYLSFLPWSDKLIYFQGQGYWIFDNWLLHDLTGSSQAEQIALACTEFVLAGQQPEGYWEYPNPEWKGRIATVEGDYATLGMLETYTRTGDERLLDSAKRWHRFLVDRIGFQGSDGMLAVNYFANLGRGMVPNNSTLTARTLAKLADVTKDDEYLAQVPGMIAWLKHVQKDTGEFPYTLESDGGVGRPHFLCYQYNAFELLDLVHYYQISNDDSVLPIIGNLAKFLSNGVTASGAAAFNCHKDKPEVLYYTAAVAAALGQAAALGRGDYAALSERAYRRVLSLQKADGGVKFFSQGNYKVLADRRPYSRNLAMILYHLLLELQTRTQRAGKKEAAAV